MSFFSGCLVGDHQQQIRQVAHGDGAVAVVEVQNTLQDHLIISLLYDGAAAAQGSHKHQEPKGAHQSSHVCWGGGLLGGCCWVLSTWMKLLLSLDEAPLCWGAQSKQR